MSIGDRLRYLEFLSSMLPCYEPIYRVVISNNIIDILIDLKDYRNLIGNSNNILGKIILNLLNNRNILTIHQQNSIFYITNIYFDKIMNNIDLLRIFENKILEFDISDLSTRSQIFIINLIMNNLQNGDIDVFLGKLWNKFESFNDNVQIYILHLMIDNWEYMPNKDVVFEYILKVFSL